MALVSFCVLHDLTAASAPPTSCAVCTRRGGCSKKKTGCFIAVSTVNSSTGERWSLKTATLRPLTSKAALTQTDVKSGSHTYCLQKNSATAKETRLWLIESLAAVRLSPPPLECLQRFKAPLIDADKNGALFKALLHTFVVQCPHQVKPCLARLDARSVYCYTDTTHLIGGNAGSLFAPEQNRVDAEFLYR